MRQPETRPQLDLEFGALGMTTGRRFWIINGSLAVVVAVIALLATNTIFHKAGASSAPRTATVTIGSVEQTVTASGNISPAQTENVGFGTGGTVSAIDVSVGQRVTVGQALAQLDQTSAQAALAAAQDQLTAAQDNLSLAQSGGETPPQQAQDAQSLASAQDQVNQAQATLTSDQQKLASDQAACASPSTTTTTVAGSDGRPSAGGSSPSASSSSSSACAAVTSDTQAVKQDQNSLTQAQDSLTSTQLSIEARRYVSPATVLQGEAAVTQAQSTVTQDAKSLAETTLTAPFSGTITSINGMVGQTVGGGGSSSSAGSGSGSGTGGGSGSGAGAGSSSSSSSTASSSSSSSAFMTIASLSNLQVVAGFPEASAVKIKVGQPATATLSALSATTIAGRVTAISPTPTVVSNVVTYSVTIGLTDPPPTVQDGMSTTVAVVVASASNALELPSSAITTTGRVSTVELLKNGKQTLTPVTTGLVGNSVTQIVSGLSSGDVVVEPSVTVSSGTGTGGVTIGGRGGAGGFLGGNNVGIGGG